MEILPKLPWFLLFLSPLVLADHNRRDALVFNFGVGEATQDVSKNRFPAGSDIDDTDVGFRAGVGFRSGLLGGNLSYVSFGQSAVTTPNASAEAETNGLTLDMVFDLPLAQDVNAFVKGGVISWEQVTDERRAGSNFIDRYYEDGVDLFWGVGFRFAGAAGMNVVVEFDRFEFKDNGSNVAADYDLLTVGVEFLL
ncbi:MAG: hypothetical protein ACI89D_000098 [Bermanella sp.]